MKVYSRIVFLTLLGSILLCADLFSQKAYKPKFRQQWDTLNEYVKTSWPSTTKKTSQLPFEFSSIGPTIDFIFYWDCYYTNQGLLVHGMNDLAKGTTGNLLYLVDKIGFAPNASLPWGMNRSQPAYLSLMVRDVYDASTVKDTAWLRNSVKTLEKEYAFWMNENNTIENHKTSVNGLVRYSHHANKEESLEFFKHLKGRFHFPSNLSETEQLKIVEPYMAEAESGWDFTPRFEGRCNEFVALDLNVLLYMYERNFDYFYQELKSKPSRDWAALAKKRSDLINKYCWDESRGLYSDYDFVNKRPSKVASINTFLPLWAGLASAKQASKVKENLKLFEQEWGVAPVEKTPQKLKYQWDFPAGWPPLFSMAVRGLDAYGFVDDAKRVSAKYLDLCVKNFNNPIPASFKDNGKEVFRTKGKIYEKYNVAEGIINDSEYPCNEFLGWSAGTYVYLYNYVNKK